MPPEAAEPAEAAQKPRPPGGRVAAFANRIRELHHRQRRGDLATLRRLDAASALDSPILHGLLSGELHEVGIDEARRVALLLRILALPMSADVLEDGFNKLGARMKAADVSEGRVQRLLSARGPALDDQLLLLARRLTRAGKLPYLEIGRLILGSPAEAERTRFDIARGYWKADAAPPADAHAPTGETE